MQYKLEDVRSFCLCDLKSGYDVLLKREGYIPKWYRVYYWKVLTLGEMLMGQDNKNHLLKLSSSTPTSLTLEERLDILKILTPIEKHLVNYAKENFKNSVAYDKLSVNGEIKREILMKTGAHSWTSRITPVTEKIWVRGEGTFDDFISTLPEDMRVREWWDYETVPNSVIIED